MPTVRFRQRWSPAGGLIGGGYVPDKGAALHDRTMDAWALVYLLDGGGFFADAVAGTREVAAGDVLVLFPGVAHGYGPRAGGRWSEAWLVFDGGVFAQLEREGALERAAPVLSPGLGPAVAAGFDGLIRDAQAGRAGDDRRTVARVHLLIADILAAHARRRAGDRGGFAEAARARLEARLEAPLDLRAVARGFGLAPETFRKRFAAAVGVAPGRYRQLRRIDRAKALLLEGLTLAEVAQRLGYCDQYFFGRQFKQLTGRTPASFRGDWRR